MFVPRNSDIWRPFTTTPTPAPIKLYINNSCIASSPRTQLSLPPPISCTFPPADSSSNAPHTRIPPSYLTVLKTRYDPKAKANAQAMEVSDKERNLRNTLREQERAEKGLIVNEFADFEKLVREPP